MDCVGVDDRFEHDPFFQAIVGLVDYPHLLQDRGLSCKCNEISLGLWKGDGDSDEQKDEG